MNLWRRALLLFAVIGAFIMVGYILQMPMFPVGLRYGFAALQFALLIIALLALVFYAARSTFRTHRFASFLLLLLSGLFAFFSIPFYVRMFQYYLHMTVSELKPAGREKEYLPELPSGHITQARTKAEFDNLISSSSYKPVIIKVSTASCPPCQKLKPIFEGIAREMQGKITFVEIDADRFDQPTELGVRAMPTLLFFKNGKEIGRSVGFKNREELINEFRNLGI